MDSPRRNFRYLNREGRWLDFHSSGLELVDGGRLRLRASPLLVATNGAGAAKLESRPVAAPSGVASASQGRSFYTVPERNELWRKDPCHPEFELVRCITEREGLGPLSAPRGLVVLER